MQSTGAAKRGRLRDGGGRARGGRRGSRSGRGSRRGAAASRPMSRPQRLDQRGGRRAARRRGSRGSAGAMPRRAAPRLRLGAAGRARSAAGIAWPPAAPSVATASATSAPMARQASRLPKAKISASSGCAPSARTFTARPSGSRNSSTIAAVQVKRPPPQRRAGQRVVVLGEAALADQLEARGGDARRGLALAGARQAVGDHVVDHQPGRPAPVALGVEARVGGVVARHDVARRLRRARSMVRGDRRGALAAGSRRRPASRPPTEALSISAPVVRSRQRYWPCALAPEALHRREPLRGEARGSRRRSRLAPSASASVGEVGAGADQDGVEAGIDDLERRGVVELGVVPAEAAEVLDQPEVAVVLRLGRPVRRVGVLGVAAGVGGDALGRHPLERPRPSRSSCRGPTPTGGGSRPAPRRAGRGWRRTSGARRRAWAAAPGRGRRAAARSGRALPEPAHREAGDRRLGDAGGRRSGRPVAQTSGPGK